MDEEFFYYIVHLCFGFLRTFPLRLLTHDIIRSRNRKRWNGGQHEKRKILTRLSNYIAYFGTYIHKCHKLRLFLFPTPLSSFIVSSIIVSSVIPSHPQISSAFFKTAAKTREMLNSCRILFTPVRYNLKEKKQYYPKEIKIMNPQYCNVIYQSFW